MKKIAIVAGLCSVQPCLHRDRPLAEVPAAWVLAAPEP